MTDRAELRDLALVTAREAAYVSRLLPRIRDIRRLGSCALDI